MQEYVLNQTALDTIGTVNSKNNIFLMNESGRSNGKKINYRICHLSKYYPPIWGGIETHVSTLARAQAALGAEVSVLCVNGLNEKGVQSRMTNTVKELDGEVRVTRIGRRGTVARLDLCPELPKHFREIIEQSYDVVHLHTPNPTMLLAWLAMRPKIPLVITHHSDIIKQQVLKYVLRPFEHMVYKQAVRILTTSANYIEGSRFLQLYKEKLNFLPLGLDCSEYHTPTIAALSHSNQLKEKYGAPIWLCVGRLVYYKALYIAIEALQLVPGKLLIIGTGPLEKELKDRAKQIGVEDRIVWLGRANAEELVGAYHAATALWFPSNARSEGFGLVQVEAMASGCPVINANIPCSGVTWVSRHEQEGLTVPLNDPVALADAAKRLLSEPGLRERLVKGSRDRVEADFDHLTMAKRSLEIYSEALMTEAQVLT